MSDDFDHDDELASAYLDDEVTPEERARVEADPALRAKVARLRAAKAAVADVGRADETAKQAALTAALAAFDDVQGRPAAAGAAPSVVALARRRRLRWVQGLGAAAAAAVLIVGGIVISTSGDGDDSTAREVSDDLATAAVAPTPSVGPVASADTDPPMAADAIATTNAETTSAMGEFETADDLGGPPPAAAAPTSLASPMAEAVSLEVLRDADDLARFAAASDGSLPSVAEVIESCRRRTTLVEAVVETAGGQRHDVAIAAASAGDYAAVSLSGCEIVLETG